MLKGILTGVLAVFFMVQVVSCPAPERAMPDLEWEGPQAPKMLFDIPITRFRVDVTAYSATRKQNVHKLRGASGERLRPGSCAVSHDLKKAGVQFGDTISLPGVGTLVVHDLTSPSLEKTVDVFFMSKQDAKKFGRKKDLALNEH